MTGPWIAAFALLTTVVLILSGVVLGLLRRITDVLATAEETIGRTGLDRLFEGLRLGSSAPRLTGRQVAGPPLAPGDPSEMLIVFAESGCEPCADLMESIVREPLPLAMLKPVAVVRLAEDELPPALPDEWTVLLQDGHMSDSCDVSAMPYAYVIDKSGTVAAGGIPNNVKDLRDIVFRGLETPPSDPHQLPVQQLALSVARKRTPHVHS